MLTFINEFKKVQDRVCEQPGKFMNNGKRLVDQLNTLIKERGQITGIAGHTTEFVNTVLDSVSDGDINGGLEKY